MAKKKVNTNPQNKTEPAKTAPATTTGTENLAVDNDSFTSLLSWKVQAIILVVLGFVFYASTFKNTWAYDDSLVIMSNEYVNQGFAGIGKIFTVDEFDSYVRSQNEVNNQLTGGRYRPLSIATFAIEQQLLGLNVTDTTAAGRTEKAEKVKMAKLDRDMHVRHVVNVLLFLFSLVVMLVFLRKVVFVRQPLAAFFTTLLFLMHPIHTEVVANVKSRDEILSLLFILLTLYQLFEYQRNKQTKHLVLTNVYFFLALLSKEYAVMLLLLAPVSLYLFSGKTPVQSARSVISMLAPLVVYFLLRIQSANANGTIAEPDVMNNPYLFAEPAQALATKLAVLFDYLKLLVYPHPLIADYTYNQVPYVDFSNWRVWMALLLNGGLIALTSLNVLALLVIMLSAV
ncbi:MAG: hypothetical protein EBZ77_14105, partial [Chitinophagia bacterium]|nr:hypothetical protein [Chitinophagia bacterium]